MLCLNITSFLFDGAQITSFPILSLSLSLSLQGAKLTFLTVAIVVMPLLETLLLALAHSHALAVMVSMATSAMLNGPFTLVGGLVRMMRGDNHLMSKEYSGIFMIVCDLNFHASSHSNVCAHTSIQSCCLFFFLTSSCFLILPLWRTSLSLCHASRNNLLRLTFTAL
jgi:hypothetical protein